MFIRLARQEDAPQIHAIAKSLYINRPNFDLKSGFIVYYLEEEEYAIRIRNNPFYVTIVNGKVIGYLMAYSDTMLKYYVKNNIVTHEEEILKILFDYCNTNNIHEFVFIDQLAISPEFQKMGYGGYLLKQLCSDTKGPYFGIILNKPICNPNENIFYNKRMKKLGEVEMVAKDKWQMVDVKGNPVKFTWGIYITETFGFKFN